ncbi:MAG: 5-formyltetrahydrofolate cyclo-ligase [Thermoguttaceae bacterium]
MKYSSPQEITDLKKKTRAAIKARLSALNFDWEKTAAALYKNLCEIDAFTHAKVVGIYVDFKIEAPTRPFLHALFDWADAVAVPYCVGNEMRFYRLKSPTLDPISGRPQFADLAKAPPFGILEPRPELRDDPDSFIAPDMIDVLVTPGLGFDAEGRRLGRGAGYYDHYVPLLRSNTALIGLCFDEQLVDAIPVDERDARVDAVVTPTRVIVANNEKLRS